MSSCFRPGPQAVWRHALICNTLFAGTLTPMPGYAADRPPPEFQGLLRSRDLSFFSVMRLDMRPAHAIAAQAGSWGIDSVVAYQNTWSLSSGAERYLKSLPGRREFSATEAAAIRALPGENYLIDAELGVADVTLHYSVTDRLSAYAIVSAVKCGGGFGDATIERFHDTLGFSSFGRPAIRRNDVNVVLSLRDNQGVWLDAPTNGGLLDPTFGLRYSGLALPRNWNLVIEAAAKVPVSGRREWLSTASPDVGVQATLQQFGVRQRTRLPRRRRQRPWQAQVPA